MDIRCFVGNLFERGPLARIGRVKLFRSGPLNGCHHTARWHQVPGRQPGRCGLWAIPADGGGGTRARSATKSQHEKVRTPVPGGPSHHGNPLLNEQHHPGNRTSRGRHTPEVGPRPHRCPGRVGAIPGHLLRTDLPSLYQGSEEAIRVPSGDQGAQLSSPPEVTCCASPPPGRSFQIPKPRATLPPLDH